MIWRSVVSLVADRWCPQIPNIIRSQRDQATGDAFLGYFYEACIIDMYRPLLELPEFKAYKGKSIRLTTPMLA